MFEDETLEDLKNENYTDLEDMVYRFQRTNDEIIDILHLKYIPTKRTGFSLNPGICEVFDLNTTLKHILPNIVKLSTTIDDIRLTKIKLKNYSNFIFL